MQMLLDTQIAAFLKEHFLAEEEYITSIDHVRELIFRGYNSYSVEYSFKSTLNNSKPSDIIVFKKFELRNHAEGFYNKEDRLEAERTKKYSKYEEDYYGEPA